MGQNIKSVLSKQMNNSRSKGASDAGVSKLHASGDSSAMARNSNTKGSPGGGGRAAVAPVLKGRGPDGVK